PLDVEATPALFQGGGGVGRLAQHDDGAALVLAQDPGAAEPGVELGDEDAVAGEERAEQVAPALPAVEVRLHRTAHYAHGREDEGDDEVSDRQGLGVASDLAPQLPLPGGRLGGRPRGRTDPRAHRIGPRARVGHDGTGYPVEREVTVWRPRHTSTLDTLVFQACQLTTVRGPPTRSLTAAGARG